MRPECAAAALGVVLASMAMAQVATLQIQVIEGEGAILAPGARNPRPLLVEVTDDSGRPVAGAAVSFHLPDEGPSGTFTNGLRTDVATTDEHGRAAPRAIEYNRAPGRFEIRIFATREQVTAGTVSVQHIADPAAGGLVTAGPKTQANSHPSMKSPGHGRKKWAIVLATAGAGAAAGVLLTGSHGSTATPATTPAGAGPVAVPPTIGAPSITVGHP